MDSLFCRAQNRQRSAGPDNFQHPIKRTNLTSIKHSGFYGPASTKRQPLDERITVFFPISLCHEYLQFNLCKPDLFIPFSSPPSRSVFRTSDLARPRKPAPSPCSSLLKIPKSHNALSPSPPRPTFATPPLPSHNHPFHKSRRHKRPPIRCQVHPVRNLHKRRQVRRSKRKRSLRKRPQAITGPRSDRVPL